MRVQDYDSVYDVVAPADIEAVLGKRYGEGRNGFWLSHGTALFPAINIMVMRDLAYLHYFREEHHPGYASVGSFQRLPRGGDTAFFPDNTNEPTWIRNEAVVPFSDAVKAAQEFAVSTAKPKCIKWDSLVAAE